MKTKYVFKSKADFQRWIDTGNRLAQSLCPAKEIWIQYNTLSSAQRLAIQKRFSEYDDIRRKKIRELDNPSAWAIGVMVDAHIIACEYNIDPLTAILCVKPICRPNEKIIIR